MNDTPAEVAVPATKSVPAARKTRVAKAAAETAAKAAADWPHPVDPAAKVPKKRAAAGTKKSAVAVPATPAPAAKVGKAAKAAKARPVVVVPEAKPVKVKLVRDGFTIPSDEYEALAALKQRALKAAHPVKKSELLRAGLRLLSSLGDAAFLAALAAVPAIKTGRPKGGKKGD